MSAIQAIERREIGGRVAARMCRLLAGLGPRTPWLLIYVVVNVGAAAIMLQSEYLIADASALKITSHADVYLATAVTIATYGGICWLLFNAMTRVQLSARSAAEDVSRREANMIGVPLLCLQGAFLVFNLSQGINVAGAGTVRTDSALNTLFVLLQPDMLFFCYYAYYRESKPFKYNLAVYALSNFMRGWSGFLLTIAFFEWCRAYRRGQLRLGPTLALGAVGLLAYPLLLSLKWFIRINGAGAFADLPGLIVSVNETLEAEDYTDLIMVGATHLVDRLQNASIVAGILQSRDTLQGLLHSGGMLPYWQDGLPQLAVSTLFGWDKIPPLSVALTDVFAYRSGVDLGSWSISPGLAGWILLDPISAPLLILYVGFLCLLSVLLTPGCQREGPARDMLWYAWLVYLIPGWLSAFTALICSLALLAALRAVVRLTQPPRVSSAAASRTRCNHCVRDTSSTSAG